MKKILILAGVALGFAACSSEDFVNDAPLKANKGITFELGYPEATVSTRGALTADRNFFWYAEKDQINLYAMGAEGSKKTTAWNSPVAAAYKATKSGPNGQFTSLNNDNLLTFVDAETTIDAIATYPAGETTVKTVTLDDNDDIESVVYTVANNAEQTVRFNEVVAPMVGFSNNNAQNEDWESVGEKVKFNLNRIYPVIKLGSVANNEKYNSYLGKLRSVELENITEATDGTYTLANNGNIAGATEYNSENGSFTITSGATAITATLTPSAEWKAGDFVNISILPTLAKETKDEVTQPKALKFKITYTFENVTLVKEIEQKTATDLVVSNANGDNMVYNIYDLDIAKDFPWIVTNENALLVFSGNFSDIYTDANQTKIAWTANPLNPEITAITAVYSEVALTEAESKKLAAYTALTSLELPNQATFYKGTLSATNATAITKLVLPKVTSYKDDKAFEALEELNLSSYAFTTPDEDVATLFFNDEVKTTLKTCNIAAVISLSPTFGYERNILFTDYAALESITLNATKTIISSNEFKGCVKLKEVKGVVEMSTAESAFEDAGTNETAQPTINMYGTVIPNSAFKGTKIKNIKHNGALVVPTMIGESAFEGNTAIEALDLKSVTSLGKNAFNGATAFKGAGRNDVVTLNVVTVPENAFNDTKVVRFQLKAATTVAANSLASTALKQVKFRKSVAKWDGTKNTGINGSFATTTNVDLFINSAADQAAFEGMTFRSITVDTEDWLD